MGRKVLVIDDDAPIITIVQAALEVTAGWQVIAATSGKEGVAIAATEQPDAILLDVTMPKLDGKAVLKLLQAQTETQKIPVIFLTAQARESEQTALKALCVAGVIIKPFSPNTIATHIKTILHWPD